MYIYLDSASYVTSRMGPVWSLITLATNSDVEIFSLVSINPNREKNYWVSSFGTKSAIHAELLNNNKEINFLKIKELKKHLNSHRDSILTLGSFFCNL